MNIIQITTILLGATALVHADTVVTSFGTVSGGNDADQAGPMWGMSVTPNEGAEPSGRYGSLYLTSMAFQSSSSGTGAKQQAQFVYLQVYDRFVVGAAGKITELGQLVATSTNAVKVGDGAKHKTLQWQFDGSVALKGDQNYMFVMSSERIKVATPADYSNLVTGAFELKPGNAYSGGIGYLANNRRQDWDLEFKAVFSSKAGSVKPPAVLLGLGGFSMILREAAE